VAAAGGEPRDFGATERVWHDLAAVAAWVPERARAAGRGGFASLLDAMTSDEKVRRTDTRLRVSGPDRYRLDFEPGPGRNAPKTIVCDGERRWRVYQDRIVVGPADSSAGSMTFLADSCWLLRARLSGPPTRTSSGWTSRPAPAPWRKPAT
jgi:hypothetical protein